MARSVLLVHNSRSVRMLLRRQMLSEAADLLVEEASNLQECEERLARESFALVAAGEGSLALNVLKLICTLPQPPAFLLVETEEPRPDVLAKFQAAGLKHQVVVPCSAEVLLARINEACHPRSLRAAKRNSIPGTTASFHLSDSSTSVRLAEAKVEATVVNISTNGILLDLDMPEPGVAEACQLFRTLPLRVEFPDGHGAVELTGKLTRLDVLRERTETTPLRLRAALKFTGTGTDVLLHLERVFHAANLPPE